MEYNDLINELLDLLDKDSSIIRIKALKKELLNDDELKENLKKYQLTKSVSDKSKLYQNSNYLEYLKLENEINLLIYNIKLKFKTFNLRECRHESH